MSKLKTSFYRFLYRKFFTRSWLTVKVRDAEFLVRPDNYIDRRLWIEGGYEDAQIDHLSSRITERGCDVFLDIGANVGLYSCLVAPLKALQELHAFECDPRNLAHLGAHLRMNSLLERVQVHPVAVGERAGEMTFHQAPESSTGRSRMGSAPEGFTPITVNVVRIDDIFAMRDRNIAIKLDVEGFEDPVLRGMTELLSRNDCVLQIEILDDDSQTSAFLAGLGYSKAMTIGADCYFEKK